MSKFHSRNVIHGFVSPDSVFLDDHFESLIRCSGNTQRPQDPPLADRWECDRGLMHRMWFMAPEMMVGEENFSNLIEVYSFEVLLYGLFADRRKSRNPVSIASWVHGGNQFPRPANVSDQFWRLIEDCWRQNRDERPLCAEIVDRLNGEENLVFPGTNANEYREYKKRLTKEVEEDPLPFELLNAVSTVLEEEKNKTQ
jgi:serine/threonine protein kinase